MRPPRTVFDIHGSGGFIVSRAAACRHSCRVCHADLQHAVFADAAVDRPPLNAGSLRQVRVRQRALQNRPRTDRGTPLGTSAFPGFRSALGISCRYRRQTPSGARRAVPAGQSRQASRSIQTGTWSLGLSLARSSRSMPRSMSRSAACGDSSTWSMRIPLSLCQAPAW